VFDAVCTVSYTFRDGKVLRFEKLFGLFPLAPQELAPRVVRVCLYCTGDAHLFGIPEKAEWRGKVSGMLTSLVDEARIQVEFKDSLASSAGSGQKFTEVKITVDKDGAQSGGETEPKALLEFVKASARTTFEECPMTGLKLCGLSLRTVTL
jgi:hypothetical protein